MHFNSCVFPVFPSTKDPKMYVQTVLDVHKKYNALVMSAFNNDAGFVAALDKVSSNMSLCCLLSVYEQDTFPLTVFSTTQACGRFINNNAVTKMAQSSSKSPELLARYCDSLLKKRYWLGFVFFVYPYLNLNFYTRNQYLSCICLRCITFVETCISSHWL